MSIPATLKEIWNSLPPEVRLVAVSKFHPAESIEEAYRAGQRVFGESRAQELKAKYELLPDDIEWHFIGTLQTNKIKYIISYVALIHGIDSFHLLREVDRHAAKAGRKVKCLLQLHIAQEESKFGFTFDECRQMLAEREWEKLEHVELCGLMGMATDTDSEEQIRSEFRSLSKFFHEVKDAFFASRPEFRELSMGMSNDYPLAIEAGSTLVRIGSRIFGERY